MTDDAARWIQPIPMNQAGLRFPPEPGLRMVAVDTASSPRLRDLASYRRDFEMAKVFAEAYAERAQEANEDNRSPVYGFAIAALTTYGRAFNGGVRLAERPTADVFDAAQLEFHQRFLQLRDKHVAHAVNDHEHAIVVAYLSSSSFSRRRSLEGVGQVHIELVPMEPDEAGVLSELCGVQLADLARRMKDVQQQIFQEVGEMGADAVYALPDLVIPTVNQDDLTKRRR